MPTNALPARGAALLLALLAALLLFQLGALPLLGPDEPRYARVAVEMHRSGNWITPTLQGQPWLEKPALYYWLAAMAFRGFGESDWAARLPSVAASLLLTGVTALLGARLFGAAAGLHAGFVLATSLLAFAYGHSAGMDMLLAATVTTSLGLLALRALGIAGPLAVPAAWAMMGLAALAKGPLGVLLPVLVMGGYVVATRDWRLLRRLVSPGAVLAFGLVAGPWYLAVLLDQGRAFVDVFLLNHNLERFTSTVHRHPGPFYYYLPVLLAGLFPWSGLSLPALFGIRPRRSRADLLLLLWLVLPLAFFSAAGSKLPGYILPCLPPLALLLGREAARLAGGPDAGWSPAWNRPVALFGLALGALIATAPFVLRSQGEPRWAQAAPVAFWALLVVFVVSRRIDSSPIGALAQWRVGAAGLLLLLKLGAPPLLAARESGRDLFLPTAGREVLVLGAWRTAWMAGYFYNDGKVREAADMGAVLEAAHARSPVLLLCGPGERRRLMAEPGLSVRLLAEGPRRNALLRLAPRAGPD